MPENEILLVIKICYSIFVCILVPVYWRHYGPANFLWFSDIALFVTLAALWLESPLLASMQAVSVVVVEIGWNLDFFVGLVLGRSPIGLAAYMFDRSIPLYLRALSLFHVPLPPFLVWLVYRFGYDERGLVLQLATAAVVMLVCYFFTKPSENINWAFGPGPKPQTWMPSGWYLALVMMLFSVCVYLPSHLLLQAMFAPPP